MKNKIKINLLYSVISLLTLFHSCDIEKQIDPSLSSLIFSSNSYVTKEGTVTEFNAYVTPKDFNLYVADVSIESSDRNILTVSITKYKNGVLSFSTTSKKAGVVTLTIIAKNKIATATVKVNSDLKPSLVISPKSVSLNERLIFLSVNESFKLNATVLPQNADDISVSWISRGTGIYVNNEGVVTAKQTGNYQVVVVSNADNTISDTCNVYVVIKVNKVTIKNKKGNLRKGEENTLIATLSPSNATNKEYAWRTKDEKFVSVNSNGIVKGVDYGITTVYAYAVSNYKIYDSVVISVMDFNINKKNLSLVKGKTETLSVDILPSNLSNKKVKWTSDNELVATVNSTDGIITALSKGESNIIATSLYNPLFLDTCKLTVTNPVDSIRINYQTLSILEGRIQKLTATVYPIDAEDLTYVWSSDKVDIASVDPISGEVKTLKIGKVNIIVTSNFGDKSKKDTCVLTINSGKQGITLSDYNLKIKKDQKYTITATINIPGETNNNVIWKSDAEDIAFINPNTGEITGLKFGTANIIASAEANSKVKDTCKVSVSIGLNALNLDKSVLNLDINSKANLVVTFDPTDATDKEIIWTSQDASLVGVDATGLVTSFSKTGTTILKVTSKSDNTKFAICTANVSIYLKKIILSEHKISIGTGDNYVLTYTLDPVNPSNPNVKWSSNNPSIVSVLNGNLTVGNSSGVAKIYLESIENPSIKDSCDVSVFVKATDMILSESVLTLNKNEIKILTATIVATSTVDQTVTWSSSDPNIAMVTPNDGVIMAKNPGNVDIIATSVKFPTLSRICKLTVVIPVKSVIISEDTIKIYKNDYYSLVATVLPADASNKLVTWNSLNTNITVNNGIVFGVDVAEGYVYATSNNGIKDSCYVKVRIKATSLNLTPTTLTLNKKDKATLIAEVLPQNTTDKSIIWSSSDNAIATVTSNGVVTAIEKGTVNIIATSSSDPNISRICVLNVVIPVSSVTLDMDTLRIFKNEFGNLKATVLPTDASDVTLTWNSINSNILVTDGLVLGKEVSEGYVYATSKNSIKDSCYVIVISKPTGITLSEYLLTLNRGSSTTITAIVNSVVPTVQTVVWSSQDVNIATVSQSGLIEAKNVGSVDIKATSVALPSISAICKVTVVVPVSSVQLDRDTLRLFTGGNQTLSATVLPTDATNKSLTWRSINANIDVNNGIVYGLNAGEGYVYATSNNGIKDSCYVIVTIKATDMILSATTLTLNKNEERTITANIIPTNTTNKSVIWSSSNNNIATVSSNGLITAKAAGSVNIIASSVSDPSIIRTCVLTVVVPVSSVSLDQDTIRLYKGDYLSLVATVGPTDATNKALTWNSPNPFISVSDGTVFGADVSSGYVFATSNNGIKDSCYVIISAKASGITLSQSVLTLVKGSSTPLTATIIPATTPNKSVTWSSSDVNIATVSANGIIKAENAGVVDIIATSVAFPSISAICKVTVIIPVSSVQLDMDTIRLYRYGSQTLTATVLPTDATYKNLVWSSANPNNINVNNGLVYGANAGEGYVFATSDNGIKDSCYVIVSIKATDMTLTPSTLTLDKNKEYTLSVTVLPANTTNKSVIWTSSNSSYATVSSSGVVRGVSAGSVTITATSVSDPAIFRTCTVTVVVPVTNVNIIEDTIRIFKGDTRDLVASILPTDATNKVVTWNSLNSYITVNNGSVNGVDVASGYVFATADNGIKDSCYVIVSAKATGMNLSESILTLNRGATKTLTATIITTTTIDQSVTWSSSNGNIATVSSTGLVTAESPGTVDIKATSVAFPSISAICKVTVIVPVTSVQLDLDTLRLFKFGSQTLSATVLPNDATNKNIIWRSTNTNIPVNNGFVYGSEVGEGFVYATSVNGIKDSCYVIVSIKATDMTLFPTTLTLEKNKEGTLTVTIIPANTTNKSVIWTSGNSAIATVSSSGVVRGIAAGSVNITVTSVSDPTISRICAVTVVVPETSVNITDDTIRIFKDDYKDLVATVLPSDATNKNLTWSSPNSNITVNSSGRVTGVNVASSYVYVTTSNGLKDSCYVIVSLKATGMILSENTLTLSVGGSRTLTSTITSTVTIDQSVTWSSSNTQVATVSSSGLIQALTKGSADIKATSVSFPSISAICKLTVINPVTSVRLNKDTLKLYTGNSETLLATVLPNDADQTITWSSNNINITVTNGQVSGNAVGEGDIVVTSSNGLKDTCRVIVRDGPVLTTFKFEASKNSGMRSDVILTKYGTSGFGGDFNYIAKVKLIPTFTMTSGTIVKVNNVVQTSGVSEQDFTSPVIYSVYSSENVFTESYRVALNFINDTLDVDAQGVLICKSTLRPNIRTAILADSMNGKKVTSIGDNGFYYCSNIISNLNFPNSITNIGKFAFYQCEQINGSLNFPNSLTTIGNNAFERCSKISGDLILPPLLTAISDASFSYCVGLNGRVSIPNSVTIIDNRAFRSCSSITSFNIPTSLITIGDYAFYLCYSLTGSLNFPNTLTTIGSNAFALCFGFNGSLTLPNSITSIGSNAFSTCQNLSGTLVIPNSLKVIEAFTFLNCNGFTGGLNIPSSITEIKQYAFNNCTNIGSLTLSSGLITIGNGAFSGMVNLRGNLVIPNTVTTIGDFAFKNDSELKGTLQLSTSLLTIGQSAFEGCSFSGNLVIPDLIKTISKKTFYNCKTFMGNLTLPNALENVGDSAFAECQYLSGNLSLPSTLKTIGISGFENCKSLTGSLTIPGSVTSIGSQGFQYCNGFTTISYKGSTILGTNVFNGIDLNKISTY